jgi:hypothetical protein
MRTVLSLLICILFVHAQFASHLQTLWQIDSLFDPIGYNFTFSQIRTLPKSNTAHAQASLPRSDFKQILLALGAQMKLYYPQRPTTVQKQRYVNLNSILSRWNTSTSHTIPKYYHALDLSDKFGLVEALKTQQVQVMRGTGSFDGAWISTMPENGPRQYGDFGLVLGGSQVEGLKMNIQFCRHCCPGVLSGQRMWYGVMEVIKFSPFDDANIPLLGIFTDDANTVIKTIKEQVPDQKLADKYLSLIRSWEEVLLERHLVTLARIGSYDRANVLLEGALTLRMNYSHEPRLVANSSSEQDLDKCLETITHGEVFYFRTYDQAFWNYPFNEGYLVIETGKNYFMNYVNVVTRERVRIELSVAKKQGAVWFGDLVSENGFMVRLGVAIKSFENILQDLSNGEL